MTATNHPTPMTATGYTVNSELCTQLSSFLARGERYAIFGHQYVDGDAIGSMLAMRQILLDMGKQVDCFTTYAPSSIYDRVQDIDRIKTAIEYKTRYDGLIFVDFTEYGRIDRLTKDREDWFDTHHKMIIDHHEVQATNSLSTAYIDPSISSTCELVYEIWSYIDPSVITTTVATHLYLGLITDTANYLHDGNSTQTLQRGLNLVSLGANKKLVQDMMLRSYSLGSLKFLGMFLSRLESYQLQGLNAANNVIYYSYYNDDDLVDYNIDTESAGIGTQMLQSVADSDVVIIFKVKEDTLGFSLRSKTTPIDHIARHYGGGGHQHASGGARVPLQAGVDTQTQMAQIVQELSQMLGSS